jgi:glycosyltransferase involved in cell wall biosynthesis
MSPPGHVLMTTDTVGGVWAYSLELARALGQSGIRVSLCTMGRRLSAAQTVESARIPGLHIHESGYKLEWMEDPWRDVERAGKWLLALRRELRPDIVHLNSFAHGALDWETPTVVVAHSCVLSWRNAVRCSPAPQSWEEYRNRVRAGLRHANTTVAVSRFLASELECHYGPLGSVATIYNARRASEYKPLGKLPYVLSCGRVWDEAKNIRALDHAAQFLRWPVFVAGEERHPEGGANALKNVTTIGQLASEDLRTWYGRAGIYALPALYEPFGLSALEAALSGCALVLGDCPSLREIWKDAAIFVSPGDSEELASAIDSLSGNEAHREEFAHRARTRAASFTPERMAQAYLRVYQHAQTKYAAVRDGIACAS